MMDQMMNQQPGSPQGQGMEQPGGEQQLDTGGLEMTEASPEEQAQYEQFVARAMTFIYSDKMRPVIKQMLAGGAPEMDAMQPGTEEQPAPQQPEGGKPIEGLAQAAALVTGRVALAAEKKGGKLSGDVVFQAGRSIVEELAEYSMRLGIKDYSQDPKALEGAFYLALDEFRMLMTQAGRANPETFKPDMDRLMQMNESGEFENMLRGLAKADSAQRQQQQSPQAQPEMEEEGAPEEGGLF
jgi:hypothetical protein